MSEAHTPLTNKDHLLMVFICCEKKKGDLNEVLGSATDEH